MNKIKVLDTINLDTEMFMTSFDKAAKLLLEQKEKLEKEGWSSIHLKMDYHYDSSELIVQGMRLETDSELDKREKKQQAAILKQEKKLERERKKYEELKNKFEK